MGDTSENKPKKRVCAALLAHVDAGKTTLSESILYLSGAIRKVGRVDHGDAFLDTYEMEKKRGITIFSKQAVMEWSGVEITLLDTPGHVDFCAEMERTLQVLDVALLIVSGTDGVQAHTETLWRLLGYYNIPVMVFVNKLDLPDTDYHKVLENIRQKLSTDCVDFMNTDSETFFENIAISDEKLLDKYMETGEITKDEIAALIMERKVFPCFGGSAREITGVKELLGAMSCYPVRKSYPDDFGARVFKVARDNAGMRLTYMRITGGSLKVKTLLSEEMGKVEQIRIYSGEKYKTLEEADAGCVCCVTGLEGTRAGGGLGFEGEYITPILEPVMTYRVILPPKVSAQQMYSCLKQLEEEEPQLNIVWNEKLQELHIRLMGEVQLSIYKNLIHERFNVEVSFGEGSVLYKETIKSPVEGVGHFEPLRHYAEVHLLLEPSECGSGMQFLTACSEDILARNWQRLILTHLKEKEFIGVLTGAPVTDIKITLLSGKSHQKHTEGGDFRQATYRAVRQGLMQAESILLEPIYEYNLELPIQQVGRAISDIQKMHGTAEILENRGDISVITGYAPVATMNGYHTQVNAYTGGMGKFICRLHGYAPCHNTDEVLENCTYDAESDIDNPTGSVFCAHGSGFYVPWYDVKNYMHLEAAYQTVNSDLESQETDRTDVHTAKDNIINRKIADEGSVEEEKELQAIFEKTYGPINKRTYGETAGALGVENMAKKKGIVDAKKADTPQRYKKKPKKFDEYLLVDGYNVIFSWKELNELSKSNLASARGRLMDILCNYQGYMGINVILVFDAYKVKGNHGSVEKYHNINVVYTKEAETADMYIEKVTHEIVKKHKVTVATSDGMEQMIVIGEGAIRMSAREFELEIKRVEKEIEGHL